MDCRDLMIGDWIILKSNGIFPDQITKVTDVSSDGIFVWDCDNLIYAEEIEPIPLTEEILVKNGFSEIHHPGTGATDEYSEWFLGGIKITEWLEDWKDHHFSTGGDDCSISFNYVHELQHLLRLCGIEKELIID